MASTNAQQRTCTYGHVYLKSSDCPTCPVCEEERRPKDGFLSALAAPARRALQNAGIQTLQQLATFTETQVLALHGMGPGSLPKLRTALQEVGLSFLKSTKKKEGRVYKATKMQAR